MQRSGAWASPAAARARILATWGEDRLLLAEGALAVARERCIDCRAAADEVYRLRAVVADLQALAARNKAVASFIEKLRSASAVPGADLPTAAAILDDALALPVKRPAGGLGDENVRAELLRGLFYADPEFPTSATEWAYFGIATGLDRKVTSGDVLREKRKPLWIAAIRAALDAAKRRRPLSVAERAEMQATLRDEARVSRRRAVS